MDKQRDHHLLLLFSIIGMVLITILASAANAASIVSDTWTTTGAVPTQCGYFEGNAAVVLSPVENTPTGVRCKIDITNTTPGQHSYLVFAKNATDESTRVAFTFQGVRGVIPAPAGLRIIP